MTRSPKTRLLTDRERALTAGVTILMILQSSMGLLFVGAYRDIEWIRATWFGNDLVTLVVVVPMLAIAAAMASRGSQRARLIWLGGLGYGVYNYAYYLLGAALNAFFPVYVLTFVASLAALIIGLAGSDVRGLADGFSSRTPVRSIGGYYVFVAAGLSAVWFGTWAAYVFAGRPTPIETEAFRLVAALDTALMVPALAVGGVLLWRRNAWGYVLAAAAGTQASLYLLVLSVNSAIAIARGIAEAPGELPTWGSLLIPTAVATILLLLASGRTDRDAARSSGDL